MKSKKTKNKNKDFNKIKIKVGKGKLPAANATDTSFKAKALTLGAQYKHTVNVDGGSERPIKVSSLKRLYNTFFSYCSTICPILHNRSSWLQLLD